jgi:hypothetical protein
MGAGAVLQFVRGGLLLSDVLYWIDCRPGAARVIQVDTVAPRKALGISRYLKHTPFSLFLSTPNDLPD